MSVIAQDVFTISMNLMDEVTQDGTFAGYPDDYKKKAWSILTLLQMDLTPAIFTPVAITSETSPIQIDDRSAMTILPYGLAAHLLLTEDMNRASFFNNRYDELKRKRPAMIIQIKDVLGVAGNQTGTEDTSKTSTNDGGSFLDPNSGVYDGGEW
jgi:hypothetical protein